MPNGGVHHCWGCCHHDPDKGFCSLRNVHIGSDRWTTCRNRSNERGDIDGPIFAIVCEVKSGAGRYGDIPYFDGCRADAVQEGAGDTVVRFTDPTGKIHEFASVAEYLDFYTDSGREL
jgi:hypothetical protein